MPFLHENLARSWQLHGIFQFVPSTALLKRNYVKEALFRIELQQLRCRANVSPSLVEGRHRLQIKQNLPTSRYQLPSELRSHICT